MQYKRYGLMFTSNCAHSFLFSIIHLTSSSNNFFLLIVDSILDSALCQHAKKVCSSCGVSGGGGGVGGAGSSVIKQNGASKESKELKSKAPNWGIKLNCTKLKGIKSLSSSLSSKRKYIEFVIIKFCCVFCIIISPINLKKEEKNSQNIYFYLCVFHV